MSSQFASHQLVGNYSQNFFILSMDGCVEHILIDHAPAHAPQLVAYQRIITLASNQYPLEAWLNYDVSFRTLAASDPLLRWDVRLTDLWVECFSGAPTPMT